MSNTNVGSANFVQVRGLQPEKVFDLAAMYLRYNGEFYNVLMAPDEVFANWINQYIAIIYDDGPNDLWAPQERLEVIQLSIASHVTPMYKKEADVNV